MQHHLLQRGAAQLRSKETQQLLRRDRSKLLRCTDIEVLLQQTSNRQGDAIDLQQLLQLLLFRCFVQQQPLPQLQQQQRHNPVPQAIT